MNAYHKDVYCCFVEIKSLSLSLGGFRQASRLRVCIMYKLKLDHMRVYDRPENQVDYRCVLQLSSNSSLPCDVALWLSPVDPLSLPSVASALRRSCLV